MTPPTWLFWPVIIQPSGTVTATGGTVTDSGGYRYHTFTTGGTFTVSTGGEVDILVVGGGGGGGVAAQAGGGGGGGGVITLDGESLLVGEYSITVGNGGSGSDPYAGEAGYPKNGENSTITINGTVHTALGGGRGGGSASAIPTGGSGGSGGGGTAFASGGAGTSGQGNNGGVGFNGGSGATRGGGGGGGAGQVGQNAASGAAGNGGSGIQWHNGQYYGGGGGGGGGSSMTLGSGGLGGGGNGALAPNIGAAGTPNTGGGMGGTSGFVIASGITGGSGIVIVRYPLSAVVLWAPTDLTNLVGWWDADDSSTLYDATSGGNLVTTHDAQVKRWEDKSGNANHATQNDANGPKIQTTSNTLNSKPVMRFAAASNSMLVVGASSDFVADLLTVVAVIRTSSADTNRGIAGRWGSVGNYWALLHRNFTGSNTPNALVRNSANTASISATATTQVNDGNGRLFGSSMESGGDLRIFVDAVEEGTTSQMSNRSGTTEMYIGSYSDGSQFLGFTGDIAEMVIFRSVADADREKLEGYLAWKWGLEANLPSTHPYKNSPP